MLTSHSAGIHASPSSSPWFRLVVLGGLSAPRPWPFAFSMAQLVSPAQPFSLPTQRTSGPTSLKITAFGWHSRTVRSKLGKS